mmetsp:Transcript_119638/g.343656  ORF Transcript_119638/g.343656 Transcript_119638/m.343656 type:complete len:205 (-) Transcript_119638:388-1002(-)
MLSNPASAMMAGWAEKKPKASPKPPPPKIDMKLTRAENELMYNIWLYLVVLYSLNNFSCMVDVKPSATRNAASNRMPWTWLDSGPWGVVGPVNKNCTMPVVTAIAMHQSCQPYTRPLMAMPHTMTGIILKLFPSICTAKDTYRNASYWHALAVTFEIDTTKYDQSGASLRKGSLYANAMQNEKVTPTTRLMRTRKTEYLKSWPS